jgi:hypothetical protein
LNFNGTTHLQTDEKGINVELSLSQIERIDLKCLVDMFYRPSEQNKAQEKV